MRLGALPNVPKRVLSGATNWKIGNGAFRRRRKGPAHRGNNDRAMDWLERAYRLRDSSIMNVIDEPLLNSLADDPRYKAFVRKKLRVPS
jgi:hypothetical protein